jgi:hypothetical protein
VFRRPKFRGRTVIDSQLKTVAISLPEEVDEYGALERLNTTAAHDTVMSNHTFLGDHSIRFSAPILDYI